MTLQLKSCCFMSVKKGSYFSAGYTLVSNEYAPLSPSLLLQISAVSQTFIIGKQVSNFISVIGERHSTPTRNMFSNDYAFVVIGFHYTHIFQFLCYKERKGTDNETAKKGSHSLTRQERVIERLHASRTGREKSKNQHRKEAKSRKRRRDSPRKDGQHGGITIKVEFQRKKKDRKLEKTTRQKDETGTHSHCVMQRQLRWKDRRDRNMPSDTQQRILRGLSLRVS